MVFSELPKLQELRWSNLERLTEEDHVYRKL
jgi:hypothetical protein